mmetsp:Transcript_42502/g.56071  ORF Transcript_42502/g.56071 Transcript_42502/m.56071 type:complete len:95 (-) Transcript_42502:83-367(-)
MKGREGFLLAVMAENIDIRVTVLFRHDIARKLPIEVILHHEWVHERLATHRAIQAILEVVVEAAPVHIVLAFQENDTLPTHAQILQANTAILFQ